VLAEDELDKLPGVDIPLPDYRLRATIDLTLAASGDVWSIDGRVVDTQDRVLWVGAVIDRNLSEATC